MPVTQSVSPQEVCQQIWATLYDYPSLRGCSGLLEYVAACVRVAWALANQPTPYVLDYETRGFNPDLHVRSVGGKHFAVSALV